MSAGDLIVVEQVRDIECLTPACEGPAHLFQIGRLRLAICQKCCGHKGVSPNTERELEQPSAWALAKRKLLDATETR